MDVVIKNRNFVEEIEDFCYINKTAYIDAIIHWCLNNNYEIEYAAELIRQNPVLKSKIQMEAEDLNFLKKTARLPF